MKKSILTIVFYNIEEKQLKDAKVRYRQRIAQGQNYFTIILNHMTFFTEARTCGKKEAPGNLQDPRQGANLSTMPFRRVDAAIACISPPSQPSDTIS